MSSLAWEGDPRHGRRRRARPGVRRGRSSASGARVVMGDVDAGAGRARSVSGSRRRRPLPPARCDTSAADCAALVGCCARELRAARRGDVQRRDRRKRDASRPARRLTWDRVIAVNLKGMFLIAKFAVPPPPRRRRRSGRQHRLGLGDVGRAGHRGVQRIQGRRHRHDPGHGDGPRTRTGSASTRSAPATTRRVCRPRTSQRIRRATRWCGA